MFGAGSRLKDQSSRGFQIAAFGYCSPAPQERKQGFGEPLGTEKNDWSFFHLYGLRNPKGHLWMILLQFIY